MSGEDGHVCSNGWVGQEMRGGGVGGMYVAMNKCGTRKEVAVFGTRK